MGRPDKRRSPAAKTHIALWIDALRSDVVEAFVTHDLGFPQLALRSGIDLKQGRLFPGAFFLLAPVSEEVSDEMERPGGPLNTNMAFELGLKDKPQEYVGCGYGRLMNVSPIPSCNAIDD